MSERDDFLDILGNIDDDIIAESAVIKRAKPQGIIKRIVTVAAAVFLFIISAIIIKNGFFDTDYILPSEDPFFYGTSQDNSDGISDITDGIIEISSDNEFSTDAPSSEIPTDSPVIQIPYEEPSEPSSSENEISTEDSSQGCVGGEINDIVFNEVSAAELIYGSTDSIPDEYPISEKTDIVSLEKIYGTKIIPTYLSGNNTDSFITATTDKKHTVYYNKDKTEVYCKNSFIFLLNNGSLLSILASTKPLPLLDIESQYQYTASAISDIPVLLFKGTDSELVSVYSAYLQKDGCYFRIQMSGILTDEEEFTNIIISLI